ncbi:MAG: type IV pilus assembly protein PilM [Armatimonadetes bacterium]|nr:type IV pilus assembly protein PilM [Akkermansiaceae bacterium]
MADTQTTVALNLGSQRIGMAVFETSKNGGLILKGYETDNIIADPAFEASREAQIKVAVEDMARKLKVSKSKVRYAISGQAVFTRFVKLPPLQDDNIEQLVTFEAQQHVPFPIHEVVWDYELIEGSGDKEVVIVAIKGDILTEIDDTVNAAGLTTAEVDVAPMALYNAFRAAYGTPEEPILIIDIGAKTSNLLYVEGKRFFTRSVSIGGSSITAAIAKEYKISFPDAEYQKVTNGLVALSGGHTETMDESVAALAMVIRNALTRLPAEIARTTNYYRSQHAGNSPRRVLLAGGGANLPYTLEFFSEKLNLPVEFFNPLAKISIGKGMDTKLLQLEAHTMGELIGLGLRGIGKSTINIDLVPAAVEVTRAADRRKPFLIAAAALLVTGFAAWAVFQNMAAGKAEDRNRTMGEIRENLSPFESEIRGLLKKEGELTEVANAYTTIESNHAFWFDLLGELRGAFASDAVWMTEMSPLYAYDPLQLVDGKAPAALPVVKTDFANSQGASASSINSPPVVAGANNAAPRSRRGLQPAPPATEANAVRIKGFWRENPRSQNIVSDLLKQLRENSKSFSFTAKDQKGKDVMLGDEQILRISVAGGEGDLGFQFELTLPLARQVAVK